MRKWAVLVLLVFICGVFAQESVTLTDDDQKTLMDNLGKLEDPKNAALAEKYLAKVDWNKMTSQNQKIAESYLEKNIDRLEGDKLKVANKYFAKVTGGKFSFEPNGIDPITYKDGIISSGEPPNKATLNLNKLPSNLESATLKGGKMDLTFKSYYTAEDTADAYQKGPVKMSLGSGNVEANDPEKGMTLSKDATVSVSGGDMVIDGVHVSPGDGKVEKLSTGWKITQAAAGVNHEATIEIPGSDIGINPKVSVGFAPAAGQTELVVTQDKDLFGVSTNAVLIGSGANNKNNLQVKGYAGVYGFSEWSEWSFGTYNYKDSKLDTQNIYDPTVKDAIPVTGLTLSEGNGQFDVDKGTATVGNKIVPLQEEPVHEISDEEAKRKMEDEGLRGEPTAARGLSKGGTSDDSKSQFEYSRPKLDPSEIYDRMDTQPTVGKEKLVNYYNKLAEKAEGKNKELLETMPAAIYQAAAEAEKKYGFPIDPVKLLALAAHETSAVNSEGVFLPFDSNNALKRNNFGGIGGKGHYYTYDTPLEGARALVEHMYSSSYYFKEGKYTMEEVSSTWCPPTDPCGSHLSSWTSIYNRYRKL